MRVTKLWKDSFCRRGAKSGIVGYAAIDDLSNTMTFKTKAPFDPKILAALGDGITLSDYRLGQVIYAQGDSGEAVFYIQKGRVNLMVASKFGKQAVMGVLGAGSFLGEECLR